jgi:hypothetical protein
MRSYLAHMDPTQISAAVSDRNKSAELASEYTAVYEWLIAQGAAIEGGKTLAGAYVYRASENASTDGKVDTKAVSAKLEVRSLTRFSYVARLHFDFGFLPSDPNWGRLIDAVDHDPHFKPLVKKGATTTDGKPIQASDLVAHVERTAAAKKAAADKARADKIAAEKAAADKAEADRVAAEQAAKDGTDGTTKDVGGSSTPASTNGGDTSNRVPPKAPAKPTYETPRDAHDGIDVLLLVAGFVQREWKGDDSDEFVSLSVAAEVIAEILASASDETRKAGLAEIEREREATAKLLRSNGK